jgi:HSP20 family protein
MHNTCIEAKINSVILLMKDSKLSIKESHMSFGLMPRRTGNKLNATGSVFDVFQEEMNKMFESFGQDYALEYPRFADYSSEAPPLHHGVKIDLKDAGDELVLSADLPGVELNDVTLAVTPHYVSLSGERKNEKSEHDECHYKRERGYGFFRRVINLPCEVDRDRVDAVLKDGVLRISLPKTKEAKAAEKKVNVKAG